MPKIIFLPNADLCPDGAVVEAEKGESVLNVALRNDIGIEHACEKVCTSTRCHIVIREGFDSIDEGDELELAFVRRGGRVRRCIIQVRGETHTHTHKQQT